MSSINTGTIDVNYPEPGKNNNSQGFRNNFASIKNNIDQAATEITALQTNSVLKSALPGTVLNNDMSGSALSNATVVGFRHKTFNLGSDLTGSVMIDVSKADVQYGSILTGNNIALGFKNWSPVGTKRSVEVILMVADADNTVTLPNIVNSGADTLENYTGTGVGGTVKALFGSLGIDSTIHLRFTSTDCGDNIKVESVNRPRKVTQLTAKVPTTPLGLPGDHKGMICADDRFLYVCIANYTDGAASIWTRTDLLTVPW